MKRIYKVNAINTNNEVLFTNECKNKKEVKNVINAFNGTVIYTVLKNDKIVSKMSSKTALEIIAESTNIF